jgi:hypothetical protein
VKNCATLPARRTNTHMTNPLFSSPSPPAKSGPRLPSVRVSGALAAVLFATGIALGAAVGPAPQSSQAGGLPHRFHAYSLRHRLLPPGRTVLDPHAHAGVSVSDRHASKCGERGSRGG